MVLAFQGGWLSVEYEQRGKQKADYAAFTLQIVSTRLNDYYGRGCFVDNLENMRRFFLAYLISGTAPGNLCSKLMDPERECYSLKK